MKDKKTLEEVTQNNVDVDTVKELKSAVSALPKMRWNISEKTNDNSYFQYGYFGDEWDNWEHMEEDERAEYFGKIFSSVKKMKDIIDKL